MASAITAVPQVVFTDRSGGVSVGPWEGLNLAGHVGDSPAAVSENRRRLAARLGARADRLVWMDQVHGAAVAVVGPADGGRTVPQVDALVTAMPGLWLAVLVADCVPLLLADREAGVVAAVHVGRRGLMAGVVDAAVDAMRTLGAAPGRMRSWCGPAIGGCCYEVEERLRDEVVQVHPATFATSRTGRASLDLPAGVSARLAAHGVGTADEVDAASPDRVGPVGRDSAPDPRAGTGTAPGAGCTADRADVYSYRRDGTTGRFAGLIRLPPPASAG